MSRAIKISILIIIVLFLSVIYFYLELSKYPKHKDWYLINFMFSNHDECLKPHSGLIVQIKNKDAIPSISIDKNEIWFKFLFTRECDLSRNSLVIKIPSASVIESYIISLNDNFSDELVYDKSANRLSIHFNESKINFKDLNELNIYMYPSDTFSTTYKLITDSYVGIESVVFAYSELSYLCKEACFQIIGGNVTNEFFIQHEEFKRGRQFQLNDREFTFTFDPQISWIVVIEFLIAGVITGVIVSIINIILEDRGNKIRKSPELYYPN